MIVYENPSHQFDSDAYNAVYAADRHHFTHRATFEALERIVGENLRPDHSYYCLDIGCGQGQVAAKVREIVSERAPEMLSDSRIYGLDLSPVAIRQCDESYPDLLWINDTLQGFLTRTDTRRNFLGRFDLIINKGGLLYTRSAREYEEMLQGVSALLREDGLYLFIQNKKFYARWSDRICKEWDRDIFDIAGKQFGTPSIIDRIGYFVHLYTKRSHGIEGDYHPFADEPLKIEFTLSSDQTEQWFVGGDETIARRARFLTSDPSQTTSIPFRTVPKGTAQAQARHAQLAAVTAEAIRDGDLVLVVPTHRVLRPDGGRGLLTPQLYNAIAQHHVRPLHYPADCLTTRDYCEAINDWIAARPDVILLGLGLEDYRRNVETMAPMLDLDDFKNRIDWIIWKLRQESEARILWLWLSLDRDITSADGSRLYRSEDLRAYQTAIEPLLNANDVEQDEVALRELVRRGQFDPARAVGRINDLICAMLPLESVAR